MTDLRQRLRSGYLLLDGAMGTQLQAAGLKLGELPELLCFTDPEMVTNIHRRYIAAGSQVIYANTFQANGYKLKNSGYTPAQVITKGIQLAQDAAAGTETYVAPSGSCWSHWAPYPLRTPMNCTERWWSPLRTPEQISLYLRPSPTSMI